MFRAKTTGPTTNSTACCFNHLRVVCPVFVIRVDVGRKKAGWCSLNQSLLLWGPMFSLWEETLHILWAQQSQDPQKGRPFGGADWDSLAEAVGGGKKTEGRQRVVHLTWELSMPKGAAPCCLLAGGQPLCQGSRPSSLHSGEISGHELHVTGAGTGSQTLVLQAAQLVSGKAKCGIQVP